MQDKINAPAHIETQVDELMREIDHAVQHAFNDVAPVKTMAKIRERLHGLLSGKCLHQIQEPAAAEQAAWHAGLDEGRAQAAPAAVAVPANLPTGDEIRAIARSVSTSSSDSPSSSEYVMAGYRAALAAAPAAAPVVLPEPAEHQCRTKPDWDAKAPWSDWEKCEPGSAADYERVPVLHNWMREVRKLFTEQQVRALLATATGLPAQAVELPTVELIGIKDGKKTSLGQVPMPPTMKARELLRDVGFSGLDDEDGDGAYAMGACEQLIEYCQSYYSTQAQADARDADGMYYLQDARWNAMVGNCPSFWRLGGGYTTSLDDAERFTLAAAMKQHKCRETDLPWLCSELDTLRRPTIDCQYMPRSWDDQRAAIAAQAAQQADET